MKDVPDTPAKFLDFLRTYRKDRHANHYDFVFYIEKMKPELLTEVAESLKRRENTYKKYLHEFDVNAILIEDRRRNFGR